MYLASNIRVSWASEGQQDRRQNLSLNVIGGPINEGKSYLASKPPPPNRRESTHIHKHTLDMAAEGTCFFDAAMAGSRGRDMDRQEGEEVGGAMQETVTFGGGGG